MQIRPFEELEEIARRRYKAAFASVPEPTVLNIDALVQFTAPRAFVWGGVGYRAPPLPFMAGVRMFVAANALRDLRKAEAPAEFLDGPVRMAVRLVLDHVRPLSRLRRLTRWGRVFSGSSPDELEGILRWLLHVEDDSSMPPPKGKVTLDFMDALAGFVREFPAWVGPDGFPRSWAAYLYGVRHQSRARAREDLRNALSTRAASQDVPEYKAFNRELSSLAGWE